MTSFEIECPPTFHGCDKIDVFAEHSTDHSDFHLIKNGEIVTIIERTLHGNWRYKSGKPITVEELAFLTKQIKNIR